MALGGGARQGLVSDAVPQILSFVVLCFVVWPGLRQIRTCWFQLFCVGAVVGLPLLYLIPLPASVWLSLPGRAMVNDLYVSLSIVPEALSLSLRPASTWRAFLSLMPPLAFALAIVSLDMRGRIFLLLIVFGFAILNVCVALLQIIGGPNSALYFYDDTNRGRAVGLFANANHYTAFLYAMIPFAAALFSGSSDRRAPVRNAVLVLSLFILIVGLSISGSRTAVILGGTSLILSAIFIAQKTLGQAFSRGRFRSASVIFVLLLLPVLSGIGLYQIFVRIKTQDPFEDLRYRIAGATWRLAREFLPFGSGFGTFERLYQMKEELPTLTPFYVNHAHNDLVELIIEGGIFSGGALIVFVIGLGFSTYKIFRRSGLIEERLEKAAVISLWLLLIHSAWDYPLRTTIISSLFAMAIGILMKPTIMNVETIGDVFHHLRQHKLADWILRALGRRRRRRLRRHRRPDGPVSDDGIERRP